MSNRDAQTIIGMGREIREYRETITRLRAELAELRDNHTEVLNEILNMAPECWDGDEAAESLAVSFVASLVQGTTAQPGHRDDCTCWSG